jgi:SAM-dependent methyltransferase
MASNEMGAPVSGNVRGLRGLYRSAARRLPVLIDIMTLLRAYRQGAARKSHCVCCKTDQHFRMFGVPPRLNALCPNCWSLERHRLVMGYLISNPDLTSRSAVLHFAAEGALEKYLRSNSASYVPVDYNPSPGHIQADIEQLQFEDQSFDVVLCSHVLEHVDDSKALHELFRVLKPGGTALLLFPTNEGLAATYEDSGITKPADRERHFGQYDHLRVYGADARQRIASMGFVVEEFAAGMPRALEQGLLAGEKIFVARKPAQKA